VRYRDVFEINSRFLSQTLGFNGLNIYSREVIPKELYWNNRF